MTRSKSGKGNHTFNRIANAERSRGDAETTSANTAAFTQELIEISKELTAALAKTEATVEILARKADTFDAICNITKLPNPENQAQLILKTSSTECKDLDEFLCWNPHSVSPHA